MEVPESTGKGSGTSPKLSIADRFVLTRKLIEGWGKLRRFGLTKFNPKHVARWRKLRRGECRRCGCCCSIMFRCPDLRDGNVCAIYERRHEQCDCFPIDPRDLRTLRGTCGFRFDVEETTSHEAPADTLRS